MSVLLLPSPFPLLFKLSPHFLIFPLAPVQLLLPSLLFQCSLAGLGFFLRSLAFPLHDSLVPMRIYIRTLLWTELVILVVIVVVVVIFVG